MTVHVHAAPTVSPLLLDRTLEEAAAIWRPTGVTFHWKRIDGMPQGEPHPVALRVIVADQKGQAPEHGGAALGWVNFAGDEPDREIHLSRVNALALLAMTRRGRRLSQLTPGETATVLGRILGRALAHELGHYLLKTKQHTTAGLMRGRRPIQDFSAPRANGFEVDAAQRQAVAARIRASGAAG
jgi:hypothetical protein